MCSTKNLTERLQDFAVSVYFLLYFFPNQCHGLRYFRAFHWTLISCFWRVCRHHRLTLFSIKLTSNDFLKSFPTFNISLLDNNRKDHLIPHVTKFCKKKNCNTFCQIWFSTYFCPICQFWPQFLLKFAYLTWLFSILKKLQLYYKKQSNYVW